MTRYFPGTTGSLNHITSPPAGVTHGAVSGDRTAALVEAHPAEVAFTSAAVCRVVEGRAGGGRLNLVSFCHCWSQFTLSLTNGRISGWGESPSQFPYLENFHDFSTEQLSTSDSNWSMNPTVDQAQDHSVSVSILW